MKRVVYACLLGLSCAGAACGSDPNGDAKKWYDNVVAASSYIGPMAK